MGAVSINGSAKSGKAEAERTTSRGRDTMPLCIHFDSSRRPCASCIRSTDLESLPLCFLVSTRLINAISSLFHCLCDPLLVPPLCSFVYYTCRELNHTRRPLSSHCSARSRSRQRHAELRTSTRLSTARKRNGLRRPAERASASTAAPTGLWRYAHADRSFQIPIARANTCSHSFARIPVCCSPTARSMDSLHAHANSDVEPMEPIATSNYGGIQSGHIWSDIRRTTAIICSATRCASSSSPETIRLCGGNATTRAAAAAAAAKLGPAASAACQLHTSTPTRRIYQSGSSAADISLCSSSATTCRKTKFDIWCNSDTVNPKCSTGGFSASPCKYHSKRTAASICPTIYAWNKRTRVHVT